MSVGIRALLAAATARLAGAGVPTPRVDAELLLADLLDVPRSTLHTRDNVPIAVAADYDIRIDRRAGREPLQHITGTAWFRHVRLEVGPGVFVPRPETELLVDGVLPHLRGLTESLVVDLCAGSGALAVAIADELPGARVIAVERSPAALAFLERNVAGTGVRVVRGDVRDPELLRSDYGRADAVVSNPPYVPVATAVEAEVQADPAVAVFAGPDGLELVPDVAAQAALLLRPGGRLALEHDDTQGETVPALLAAGDSWTDIKDHLDLAGRPRYATATRR